MQQYTYVLFNKVDWPFIMVINQWHSPTLKHCMQMHIIILPHLHTQTYEKQHINRNSNLRINTHVSSEHAGRRAQTISHTKWLQPNVRWWNKFISCSYGTVSVKKAQEMTSESGGGDEAEIEWSKIVFDCR